MVDERTMLRATFDRLDGLAEIVDPWVVCNAEHHHLVSRDLFEAGFKPDNVILEPVGRNTAPAAAAAAMLIAERDPDALMLVLPADHVIEDERAFHAAVAAAVGQSREGMLATFGIVPTYPETGYGYIEVGEAINADVSRVARFVEKPDAATAQKYLDTGKFLWNSGMFLFAVRRYLRELERFAPEILDAVRRSVTSAVRDNAVALDAASFSQCPSNSIDFAVMENTDSAVVVPLDAGWSDVGSWAALWELAAEQGENNVFVGDIAAVDVTGSYLRSESRLVAAIGVENLVVVETADAVMVAPRERSQDVKAMVELLKNQERREAEEHRTSSEPWGSAEVLFRSDSFRIRLLAIDPNEGFPADLGTSQHLRTFLGTGSSGTIEVDGEVDDITGSSAEVAPGRSVKIHAPGPDVLEIIEVARAV
jgi:mannose-1-phosphate guanylyltransferase/mannose-6-phosphate isomerase